MEGLSRIPAFVGNPLPQHSCKECISHLPHARAHAEGGSKMPLIWKYRFTLWAKTVLHHLIYQVYNAIPLCSIGLTSRNTYIGLQPEIVCVLFKIWNARLSLSLWYSPVDSEYQPFPGLLSISKDTVPCVPLQTTHWSLRQSFLHLTLHMLPPFNFMCQTV